VYALWVRQYPFIMKFLTFVTIYFEEWGPTLFFIPVSFLHGPLRTIGVLGFVAMHLGFGFCLELGFFMYIPPVCSLVFLPAWFWDTLLPYLMSKTHPTLAIYYAERVEGVSKAVALFRMFFLRRGALLYPMVGSTKADTTAPKTFVETTNPHHPSSSDVYLPKKEDREDVIIGIEREGGTNGSGVVYDGTAWIAVVDETKGRRYTGVEAVKQLFLASPILWVFSPLFRFNFLKTAGTYWSLYVALPIASKIYPVTPLPSVPKQSKVLELMALFFLIFIINWNFATFYQYPVTETIRWVGPTFRVDQWWGMFSPYPPKEDGWTYMPGILANGTEVNIFAGFGVPGGLGDAIVEIGPNGEHIYKKPPLVSHQFPIQRWRKYMMNLEAAVHQDKRLHFGRYLCREWNLWGRHPGGAQLKSFKIIYVSQVTPPPGQAPAPSVPIELWSHMC